MQTVDLDQVLRQRLATQRLSGAPLTTALDAVRLLTCVQAQDAPLAVWSLGMRVRDATMDSVLATQSEGGFVRTHVLRPTWHYVAAADLRWILRLTSAKVEAGMGARHRQLGLDDRAIGQAHQALVRLLAGAPQTRRQLGALNAPRLPPAGEVLGHVLLLAELRGLICSGPPTSSGEHTYALVEEVVPASPNDDLEREDAIRLLVQRFFTGHGPATDHDLARWCSLTLAEIRGATADLANAGDLVAIDLDGEVMWCGPSTPPRAARGEAGWLLPTFDEAHLTYPRHSFPRGADVSAADRARMISQSGGGIVVLGRRDVGTFRRTLARTRVEVVVRADGPLSVADQRVVESAAQRYAAFVGRDLALRLEHRD